MQRGSYTTITIALNHLVEQSQIPRRAGETQKADVRNCLSARDDEFRRTGRGNPA